MNKISVLFYKDKWNDGLVRAEDGTIESAALELLSKRVKDGFWYDEDAFVKASYILDDNDGTRAWNFLRSRRDYEYEWVEERII